MTKAEAYAVITKIAHQMVTGFGLPSPYADDHTWCKTTPLAEKRRVIRSYEATDTQAKDWAMRVIEAAKVLYPSLPPPTWFDGGYLGNGHCSFMWARNGAGACCRLPHGHEGPHVAAPSTSKTDTSAGER